MKKISIMTPTFNREEKLVELYDSILKASENSNFYNFEWLIMDDGSSDNTKSVVSNMESKFEIIYKYQENKGKPTAMNSIVLESNAEFGVSIDSDDVIKIDFFDNILEKENELVKEGIGGIIFTAEDANGNILGTSLPDNHIMNHFECYYKYKHRGDKTIIFKMKHRKKLKYTLEENERFITEAILIDEYDKNFKGYITSSKTVEKKDFLSDGLTKNIYKLYLENPKGYQKHYISMINRGLSGISFIKRLNLYFHYRQYTILANSKNKINKKSIIFILFWIPLTIFAKRRINKMRKRVYYEKRDTRSINI